MMFLSCIQNPVSRLVYSSLGNLARLHTGRQSKHCSFLRQTGKSRKVTCHLPTSYQQLAAPTATFQNVRCTSTNKDSGKTAGANQPGNSKRNTETAKSPSEQELKEEEEVDPSSLGIFKRFQLAYKQHGKVLVSVHLVTSSVWFGCFYYAAASGIDMAPVLKSMGIGESVIKYYTSVGNVATAYLLYKLATPARYTVTIFGTYSSVRYLRRWGYFPPKSEDSIRKLVREGRVQMKEKMDDLKDDVKDKFDDIKDKRRKGS